MIAQKIILFDGVCNLCSKSVHFIIKRDKNNQYQFASLQSHLGEQLLIQYNINPKETDSIVLISNDIAYIKARAALQIARNLNGLWPVLYVFNILPDFILNGIYDFIARNRYNWFGKKEQCMVPTKEIKSKFLDL